MEPLTYHIKRLYLSVRYRANIWRIERIEGRPQGRDWQVLREITLNKYRHACANCKNKQGRMDVHHVIWLSVGGSNRLSNLVALCFKCHKSAHPWMKEQ